MPKEIIQTQPAPQTLAEMFQAQAHHKLLIREDLKPYLKGRFMIGQPLDGEVAFNAMYGDCATDRSTNLQVSESEGVRLIEAYNQTCGLQGLEVADVESESRSGKDSGGAFLSRRDNRG